MDENNNNMDKNRWEMPPEQQPPKKENPFKDKMFYVAYGATIIVLVALSLILAGGSSFVLFIAMIICIPYAIVGTVVWAIVRIKNKAIALGILLGSITPFAVVFFATGGCGLFGF